MPIRRTYVDIYQDAQRRIKNNTPINNFNSQGITRAFVDVLAVEVEKVYTDLDFIYTSFDPTRAVGSDLDKLGLLVGERRTGSTVSADYSDTNFYFYIDTRVDWNIKKLLTETYSEEELIVLEMNGYISRTNGQITQFYVPDGIIIGNSDKTITYVTSNPIVISAENATCYVGVVAAGTGPDYNVTSNSLVVHSIGSIPELSKVANMIKCTNTFPIQNGSYSMTDDEYRYMITTARAALTTNELSIRRAALSVPGIRDIFFEKNKFGNGTISIIVDGISPLISQGLISAVKERVEQNMSYGDVLFVSAPEYIGVELNFNISTDIGTTDSLSLRDQARNAIIQYINDLPIGGEIVWNQIIANVLNIQGIKDFIPVMFKCGSYDAVNKINKEQIILRFMNQTAKYNEKFYCDSGLISACVS